MAANPDFGKNQADIIQRNNVDLSSLAGEIPGQDAKTIVAEKVNSLFLKIISDSFHSEATPQRWVSRKKPV